ncbi:MAG: molybdopterin-dependent oxidoreductase, partial [Longimicrobiales bacterium]|nr:molybdopterin-dependent oxidoreductase [Longimicrobiales bacterium]
DALEALLSRIRETPAAGGSIRAVASPFASNEDLGALRTFLKVLGEAVGDGDGSEVLFRSPRAKDEVPLPGFSELARRRDLAPNVNGAEILGFRRVGDDQGEGGLSTLEKGDGGMLVVLGDELLDQAPDFGASADLFVYLGSYPSEAVREADFALPVTTFAEQEGTFTNHAGRVQRFWPGLQAPGAARPAWLILHALAAELEREGDGAPARAVPATAGEAFRLLAEEVPELSGLTYEFLGTKGAPVNEPVEIAGD